jgi:hypothetical protein
MRACIRIPRPRSGAGAYQRGRRLLGLASLLVTIGCASVEIGTQGALRGSSGAVTWEVSDIGRIVSSDNQRIRWSYLITLRNTSDRVIQLERVEQAMVGDYADFVGGAPTTQPFRRTLGARSDLRIPMSDSWGWVGASSPTFGGAALLRGTTAFRRFSGTDDRGTSIEIPVQVRLDPSVGVLAKPPTRPQSLPAPTTLESTADLARLVGLWRGSYRDDGSLLDVPIEVMILTDGTFQVAENEPVTNRFSRTVQVKDGGLDYSGGRDRGTLTLHESAAKRMLVGRVSQRDGQPYAIYLEAQPPASAASGPPTAPPRLRPETPVPTSARLDGNYNGVVSFTIGSGPRGGGLKAATRQTAHSVTGSYWTVDEVGHLSGTVTDTDFLGSVVFPNRTCKLVGKLMDGGATFTGTFQCSTGEQGTFALNRT